MSPRFEPTSDFWKAKRVILTGHTGFKGSWLTLMLVNLGAIVRGYALEPDTEPSMFKVLELDRMCDSVIADVRDKERLSEAVRGFAPDIAIHMAAQPLVRLSYREPLATFEINVQGTANFLEACRGIDTLRAIVVVTTDKCYENRASPRPYREDEPLGGHDPYSASKACAELVTQAYRRSFFSEGGAAIASARAGNVFGGGDWSADRLIPDIVRAYSVGRPVIIRNPSAVRPWQHVAAPLTGYLMLARALWERPKRFTVPFNFGPASTDAITVRELVELTSKKWGEGAAWEARVDPNAPHEAAVLMLDPARAREMLGWKPDPDLTAALGATVEWYKACYGGAAASEMRRITQRQIDDLATDQSVGGIAGYVS